MRSTGRVVVVVATLLMAVQAFATASTILVPIRVHLRYNNDGERIELKITTTPDGQYIRNIRFIVNGKSVMVPKAAYSDLKWPGLHTVQVLATPPIDEELGGSLAIAFELPNHDELINIPTTVAILYYPKKGAFLKRVVQAQNESGLIKSSITELKP